MAPTLFSPGVQALPQSDIRASTLANVTLLAYQVAAGANGAPQAISSNLYDVNNVTYLQLQSSFTPTLASASQIDLYMPVATNQAAFTAAANVSIPYVNISTKYLPRSTLAQPFVYGDGFSDNCLVGTLTYSTARPGVFHIYGNVELGNLTAGTKLLQSIVSYDSES